MENVRAEYLPEEQGGVVGQIEPVQKMPQNLDAEVAIISAMMTDTDAMLHAVEYILAEDFFGAAHRHIFEAVKELYETGQPMDFVTLSEKLQERGLLAAVGGTAGLARIAGTVSTSANIHEYIKIVKDKSTLRKIIKMTQELSAHSYAQALEADDILDIGEKTLFGIAQRRNMLDFVHIQDALLESIEVIEKAYKLGSRVTGVESGFFDLDLKTAGFHPADLILIAARPSMGKTALALNMAYHAAVKGNIPTAIFSLEMSKEQLANRLLSSAAMVDANKLRTGQLSSADWDAIALAAGELSVAPIYIDDTPGVTIGQLRSKCRKLKLERGLGFILIDYLQLMSGSSGGGEGRQRGAINRQQEISEISRSLKALAREMKAPVVALSQLSRAPEARADRRPILSDLRESGAIEQDADLVCFIYRDEYYNPETEKQGIAEVIVAKQRNGATGTIELGYQGNYVRFVNLENPGY